MKRNTSTVFATLFLLGVWTCVDAEMISIVSENHAVKGDCGYYDMDKEQFIHQTYNTSGVDPASGVTDLSQSESYNFGISNSTFSNNAGHSHNLMNSSVSAYASWIFIPVEECDVNFDITGLLGWSSSNDYPNTGIQNLTFSLVDLTTSDQLINLEYGSPSLPEVIIDEHHLIYLVTSHQYRMEIYGDISGSGYVLKQNHSLQVALNQVQVPEPSSGLLLLLGCTAVGFFRRKLRNT